MENKHVNLLMFSGDYDKALAAFIIANAAREMESKVTIFFAFWGLLLLRDPEKVSFDEKNGYEKIFGSVTPRGAEQLPLSRMNMGGIGKYMLLEMMEANQAPQVKDLLEAVRRKGVNLFACKLSLEIMGFSPEELFPEVKVVDVKEYLKDAWESDMQLFI